MLIEVDEHRLAIEKYQKGWLEDGKMDVHNLTKELDNLTPDPPKGGLAYLLLDTPELLGIRRDHDAERPCFHALMDFFKYEVRPRELIMSIPVTRHYYSSRPTEVEQVIERVRSYTANVFLPRSVVMVVFRFGWNSDLAALVHTLEGWKLKLEGGGMLAVAGQVLSERVDDEILIDGQRHLITPFYADSNGDRKSCRCAVLWLNSC